MPIYDYHCDHCGHSFSAVQSFKDEPVAQCPNCGRLPRRLISQPAIVFKGSGWYKTDSRASSAPAEKDGSAGKEASSGSAEKSDKAHKDKAGEKGSAAPS